MPCSSVSFSAASSVTTPAYGVVPTERPGPAPERCAAAAEQLPVAGGVRGPAGVLDLHHVAPGVGPGAVEVGETVDLRQLAAGQRAPGPALPVRVGGER